MTPTIVEGVPFSVTDLPRTFGSAANRRCHMPWLSTITLFLPGVSSSALKPRPSVGPTCSSSNTSQDTAAFTTRSAPPASVSVAPPPAYAAIRSNTVFC